MIPVAHPEAQLDLDCDGLSTAILKPITGRAHGSPPTAALRMVQQAGHHLDEAANDTQLVARCIHLPLVLHVPGQVPQPVHRKLQARLDLALASPQPPPEPSTSLLGALQAGFHDRGLPR